MKIGFVDESKGRKKEPRIERMLRISADKIGVDSTSQTKSYAGANRSGSAVSYKHDAQASESLPKPPD